MTLLVLVRVNLNDRLEALLFEPFKVIGIFRMAAVGAILMSLPFSHYSHRSLAVLLIAAGVATIVTCVEFMIIDRLPVWSIHIDILVGVVFVSVLAAVGPSAHVNFAVLYIWIAFFAALNFRPIVASLHIAGVGVAYAVVLAVGSDVPNPATDWMAMFGTATMLSAVAYGLMRVLRRTSREDPLTRMANRRSWDERTDEELERARRNKTPLSIAVIDIDDFKAVNDREGHQAGDRLLRKFADEWGGTIRGSGDFMARLGGDEFGLLAPGSDDIGIRRVVERLDAISLNGVSCSIGVATWNGTETVADLFRRADEAMYQIKRERRAG
jgi:diguanylate cyclase (GGDEF)-like protein